MEKEFRTETKLIENSYTEEWTLSISQYDGNDWTGILNYKIDEASAREMLLLGKWIATVS